MKKHAKSIVLAVAITLAVSSMLFAVFLEPAFAKEEIHKSSTVTYYLGEYNGYLAIFRSQESEPLQILDVRLDSLPERDISRIKSGIYSNDLGEIISVVEDYE
ncbi:MAG: hypothetical protein IJN95_02925 [Clostridia bacterium]|nr:hypothetical protein [Clostridia bacterium]